MHSRSENVMDKRNLKRYNAHKRPRIVLFRGINLPPSNQRPVPRIKMFEISVSKNHPIMDVYFNMMYDVALCRLIIIVYQTCYLL